MATLIEVGQAVLGALASGAGLIRSFFPDKDDAKDVTYRIFEDNQPLNGFRLILVVQEKAWNKAVRVYKVAGSNDFYEVKAGDTTGTKCKGDLSLKHSDTRVDFPQFNNGKDYFTLNLMKPKAFGIWYDIQELRIYRDRLDNYNGKSLVVYWADDGDQYFKNDANLIKPFQM